MIVSFVIKRYQQYQHFHTTRDRVHKRSKGGLVTIPDVQLNIRFMMQSPKQLEYIILSIYYKKLTIGCLVDFTTAVVVSYGLFLFIFLQIFQSLSASIITIVGKSSLSLFLLYYIMDSSSFSIVSCFLYISISFFYRIGLEVHC